MKIETQLYSKLKSYQHRVNQILRTFFIAKEKEFLELLKLIPIIRDLRDFVLAGGKRLRGFLVLLGYQFDGGDHWREDQEILKFSAGVELLHAALLIHDDIIDKDKMRRGKKTLHEKFGNVKAQHAANLLFCFGFELAMAADFSSDKKIKAFLFLRKKLFNTAIGEILDVHFSGRADLKKSDILKIHTLKTANYTIEAPLICGVILAGGDANKIAGLQNFSTKLGQAFQIKDDILGIFGLSKMTGKSIGSDLREGKETLLIKTIKDLAPKIFKKEIKKFFGKEKITKKQEQKIRNILSRLKVEKEVENEAIKLAKSARNEISKFSLSTDNKKLLFELADFMVRREK